jgi:trimeric autotransporter adhesin
MKNFKKLSMISAMLIAVLMSVYQVNAQTHGAGAINAFGGVGTLGTNHTHIGNFAGSSNAAAGVNNTNIGTSAGQNNTTSGDNTCVGFEAGKSNTATGNTFIGSGAGTLNAASTGNTFTGYQTGTNNTKGDQCTFNGYQAGLNNGITSHGGSDHTFMGYQAGYNCGVGDAEGTCNKNTFVGSFSGYVTTLGFENVFSGYQSGYSNRTGYYNVSLGAYSGYTNTTGKNNLYLGYKADAGPGLTALINSTAIGANATVMKDNNMILGNNSVNVGIGLSGDPTGPLSKIDVKSITQASVPNYLNKTAGNFYQTGANLINPAVDDFIAVKGITDVTHPNGRSNNYGGDFYAINADYNFGARGSAIGTFGAANFGLYGIADNSFSNYGVVGWAVSTIANSTNMGGNFTAGNGASLNYGVMGYVSPFAGAVNVGVYGFVSPGTLPGSIAVFGDLGAGTAPPCLAFPCAPVTAPDMAGFFNGDLVSTTAVYTVSDATLKENIQDISNPLDIINQLNPKSYSFNQQQAASMWLASGSHYGLLAQDVQNILPGLIKDCVHPARYDSTGTQTHAAINFKAVNYTELIPFLIAGMKKQQSEIENQQQQIDVLSLEIKELQGGAGRPGEGNGSEESEVEANAIDVTLSSKSIVLNQNQPNPFKEQTTITYYIPDDAKNVLIIFTDSKGNVMKEVAISEKGKGQLNVYAQDLSSGIYTYTLVADGVTIDSKKMVCNK